MVRTTGWFASSGLASRRRRSSSAWSASAGADALDTPLAARSVATLSPVPAIPAVAFVVTFTVHVAIDFCLVLRVASITSPPHRVAGWRCAGFRGRAVLGRRNG